MGNERDYKKLFETGEILNRELQKTIDLQSELIQTMTSRNANQDDIISLLTEENNKLKEALDEITKMCEEQQGWVEKLLGEE